MNHHHRAPYSILLFLLLHRSFPLGLYFFHAVLFYQRVSFFRYLFSFEHLPCLDGLVNNVFYTVCATGWHRRTPCEHYILIGRSPLDQPGVRCSVDKISTFMGHSGVNHLGLFSLQRKVAILDKEVCMWDVWVFGLHDIQTSPLLGSFFMIPGNCFLV